MENSLRKKEHQRAGEVEEILKRLEELIPDKYPQEIAADHPVFFIMGCARSGTTLVTQYLSQHSEFCYPSNFISRFYYAPYVGSMLQRLMFDLDSRDELFGFIKERGGFSSNLGKTKRPLAPNEFWYYWRRFFKFGEIQKLDPEQIKDIDKGSFVNGLLSIQSVFKKPMFLKGMIANWHIPLLAEMFPNSYFIIVKRDLTFNSQSLLLARERFFGNTDTWYSFKPEEYNELKNLSPVEQVVAQVFYTNRAIGEGLRGLPNKRVIEVKYEEFCENPAKLIVDVSNVSGISITAQTMKFDISNNPGVDRKMWHQIERIASGYE